MDFLAPMGNVMIEYIQPLEQKLILDIASGTGEPALTVASLLHKGHIVMTDLSEDMLAIAKAKAISLSLQNVDTKVCDVTELPFADNRFDAVTCRFEVMFFPDMRLTAREMIRVL
jgi:ubiquinone/menaquinone biosynthesis C-methylase UbiE